jgi:hypothetical protein
MKDTEDTSSEPSSADNTAFLNGILEKSLRQYEETIELDYREYNEDMNSLQHITSEYLNEFIILGYTPDHKRVVIRYASSPQGYDSLKELARIYLSKVIMDLNLND